MDSINFDEEEIPLKLRGRQPEWVDAIERDGQSYSRLLMIAPGGIGKSSVMAYLAKKKWDRLGLRTLITENREHLVEQTAGRVRDETGLNVDVEMAGQHASPHASVVVASTQSLGRPNRLTGFADDHFGFVVPDECHLSLAPQAQRILNYHHYGAESLSEDWMRPADGTYTPKSIVCGFTASPNLGEKKSLSDWYHKISVNYSYLEAIEEGWLVGVQEVNVPVAIDTRKFRTRRTAEGADFNVGDQAAAIIPIIKELAEQIVRFAHDKKTICFLPSVECARLMAETLNGMGMRAIFASGECLDKGEKTKAYNAAGPGTVFCNCALVTYGVDFVDTDCIAPFSAMISKCRYIQSVYRGTRVLPGLVRDDMTAEERRAAIAGSLKPFLTVLSPFFISDRIDICEAYSLFGDKPEAKRKNLPKEQDFTSPAKIRDYIEALNKHAKKYQKREARIHDPVALSISVGPVGNFVPANAAEAGPVTEAQAEYLRVKQIDPLLYKCAGEADRAIKRLEMRHQANYASPAQMQLLLRFGMKEDQVATMTKWQAGAIIGAKQASWKR